MVTYSIFSVKYAYIMKTARNWYCSNLLDLRFHT